MLRAGLAGDNLLTGKLTLQLLAAGGKLLLHLGHAGLVLLLCLGNLIACLQHQLFAHLHDLTIAAQEPAHTSRLIRRLKGRLRQVLERHRSTVREDTVREDTATAAASDALSWRERHDTERGYRQRMRAQRLQGAGETVHEQGVRLTRRECA